MNANYDLVMEDCQMYSPKLRRCVGLKTTECRYVKNCSFYKPREVGDKTDPAYKEKDYEY